MPDVADRALHAAAALRRRRRIVIPAVAALAIAVVALTTVIATGWGGRTTPDRMLPVTGNPGSLPDRLYGATAAPSLTAEPLSRAALIFEDQYQDLVAVGADGDQYRRLPSLGDEQSSAHLAALSPDGTKAAFTWQKKLGEYTPQDFVDGTASALKILDLTSGTVRTVPTPGIWWGLAAGGVVAWSPDGRYLAFQATRLNASGEPQRQSSVSILDARTGDIAAANGNGALLGWTTDGLVVSDFSATGGSPDLALLDPSARQISRRPSGFVNDDNPVLDYISPDGAMIAALHIPRRQTADQVAPYGLRFAAVESDGARALDGAFETRQLKTAAVVGWTGTRSVALAELDADGALLVERILAPGRGSRTLLTADPSIGVTQVWVAQNVLAGGKIRHAQPPS